MIITHKIYNHHRFKTDCFLLVVIIYTREFKLILHPLENWK